MSSATGTPRVLIADDQIDVVDALRRAWALTTPTRPSVAVETEADDESDPLSLIEIGAWAALGRGGPTVGGVTRWRS